MNARRSVLDRLRDGGVPDPTGDLRRLADWAFAGVPEHQRELAQERWDIFDDAIARRIRRQPVSQIIGRRAFWRHDFIVTPDVLDPRAETEALVELALTLPFRRVLDLGTGSGCVAISLLAERPDARGVATDVSDAALSVAARNAAAIGVADRLQFLQSAWFDRVDGLYDLIVSNPPYIAQAEMSALAPEVRDHEPHVALTDGGDGLGAYRIIAAGAGDYLIPGGALMVEIGAGQGDAVPAILAAANWRDVQVYPDLNARPRVVAAISR